MPQPVGSFSASSGETLIVLGSGVTDEFPDLDTYWRCVYAARMFRAGSFERIVLSGGAPPGRAFSVASVMQSFLQASGVPAEKVLLETRSQSTHENALRVRELLSALPSGKIVLLTSDYHTQRAAAVFQKVGVPVSPVIVPYVIKLISEPRLRPMLVRDVLLERLKLAWYRYNGWI
jgi:uncharacterized SAM-binding protein YcdF (DUF218 family)